jgi:hypothetical protein
MKYSCNGSALLIVLFMLTVIVIWTTNLWRGATYLIDSARIKQEYEQQFRLTEALLNYGIAAAKIWHTKWKNDSFLSQHQASCHFTQWPPMEKGSSSNNQQDDFYSGKITLVQREKQITVNAQLLKKDIIRFGLHCTLEEIKNQQEKKGDQSLIIKEWAVDEQ